MTTLLGLHGRRGVGKDTAFGFVSSWAAERGVSAHRRGFADSLKLSFARLFIPDISLQEAVIWCDELKMPPGSKTESRLMIVWGGDTEDGTNTVAQHTINGRVALQRYGTEGHRDVFGENFWVDALLPTELRPPAGLQEHEHGLSVPIWPLNFRGPLSADPPDIAVITDVRFPNEAERIRDLGGQVWEIWRDYLHDDTHSSEKRLPKDLIDRTVFNNSSLNDFRDAVHVACKEKIPCPS